MCRAKPRTRSNSRYIVEIVKLFDMVNTMACRIWQVSPIAVGHRSKTQQDCLGIQGLVGWLHPRRARLGLIEATSPASCAHRAQPRHPRRARLGLIEARSSRGDRPRRPWHPRRARLGLIEARRVEALPMPSMRAHPRRARLGLIEAMRLLEPMWDSAWHPRRARLGLIEARQNAENLCQPHRIRGARASASLKLDRQRQRHANARASEARAPRPH